MSTVIAERRPPLLVVTIDRPEVRNSVDRPTADALANAFRDFDRDDELRIAILTGAEGTFCAGADLKAIASGDPEHANRLDPVGEGDGPMGPTRMELSKPVVAAVEGHAVAGGLELALWCDLRVASATATFGVFNRRWGVPLIDGGTIRLARAVGQSRALDMLLTGRAVTGTEAHDWGLVNHLTEPGRALEEAIVVAQRIAEFPQSSLRADRRSAMSQWGKSTNEALAVEFTGGIGAVQDGESVAGAQRFELGKG
ncbi:MAG: crotonase/enoyl-CoA hydratase family protein [Actinomycetota bacterium]